MVASQVLSGSGNPNGVAFGNPGDVYQDQTGAFWLNVAAPSTWVQFPTGGSGGDRTWYGTGVDGDLVVATGTVVVLDENRSYNDVTIQTGACLYTGGWLLRVANTLLIEGTGTLEDSGGGGQVGGPLGVAGGFGANNGLGGAARGTLKSGYVLPASYTAGDNPGVGGTGGSGVGSGSGGNGNGVSNYLRTRAGQSGGDGGNGNVGAGGTGGPTQGSNDSCYATAAVSLCRGEAFWDVISGGGGGGGGGGGPAEGNGFGGSGGGGGGTMGLYARTIVCPDGAIRSNGGNGGAATAPSTDSGGGGGGGMGGTIFLITDGPFDPSAKCDVTGGIGAAGAGAVGTDGVDGDSGEVVAISPIFGPL